MQLKIKKLYLTITILIFCIPIVGYFSYQKGYESGNIAAVNILKIHQEKKLNECLDKAEKKFDETFKLNSTPANQKDHPDARTWISSEIANETEETRNKDREFCLKLHK